MERKTAIIHGLSTLHVIQTISDTLKASKLILYGCNSIRFKMEEG